MNKELINKIAIKLDEAKALLEELSNITEEQGEETPSAIPVNASDIASNGKYYLPLTDGKAVLSQSMFTKPGTIYVVCFNFTLTGNIVLPANSHLYFDGGSISGNYVIDGNGASINENVAYNIFNNTEPKNFNLSYIDIRWFGGVPDYNESSGVGTDNSDVFKRVIAIIGKYYSGLYIKLIGQYYIAKQIKTPYDVCIYGSHCPVRDGESNRAMSSHSDTLVKRSSPSLIAVAPGITAFKMIGRAPKGKNWQIGFIWLKNIKVVGRNNSSSIFIEYLAHGCPTRNSGVSECEFTGFNKVFYFNCKNSDYNVDTQLGNFTIEKCLVYACNQFIVARGTKLSNSWTGNTLNNLKIKDSNIEQNGAYCIDLGYRDSSGIYGVIFGNLVIDNNNLEGQKTPIRALAGYGNITISNNYFEATSGDYVMDLGCTNAKSRLILMNNYYSVHNNKVKVSVFTNKHIFDNATIV